jgi:3'-phosphoadenosine 5'-phosphosulfate (PAPS) 3'-phosphatase
MVLTRKAYLSEELDLDECDRPARLFGMIAVRAGDVIMDAHGITDLRPSGSSLKFCVIAEREADVYPRLAPTMEWDTAAGHAVLLAAGGTVTDLHDCPTRYGKLHYRNGDFVAWGTPQDDKNERTRYH